MIWSSVMITYMKAHSEQISASKWVIGTGFSQFKHDIGILVSEIAFERVKICMIPGGLGEIPDQFLNIKC